MPRSSSSSVARGGCRNQDAWTTDCTALGAQKKPAAGIAYSRLGNVREQVRICPVLEEVSSIRRVWIEQNPATVKEKPASGVTAGGLAIATHTAGRRCKPLRLEEFYATGAVAQGCVSAAQEDARRKPAAHRHADRQRQRCCHQVTVTMFVADNHAVRRRVCPNRQ